MNGRDRAYLIIQKRRKAAEEARDALYENLRKDEVFNALVREENAAKWDFVKSRSEEEKTLCEQRITESNKKITEYLVSRGLGADALEVRYSCPICNDTGKINGKDCECLKRLILQEQLKVSPLLIGCAESVRDLDYDYYGEEAEQKRKYAEFLSSSLAEGSKRYYLISGKTGTAKTYIACTLIRDEITKGKETLALNAIKLNKAFLEYHCAAPERKEELWRALASPDVLLIDDLGVEQILNKVTVPYLYELLIERIDKVTLITTNLGPQEIEARYGQRILSRLLDKKLSVALLFKGKDLRFVTP